MASGPGRTMLLLTSSARVRRRRRQRRRTRASSSGAPQRAARPVCPPHRTSRFSSSCLTLSILTAWLRGTGALDRCKCSAQRCLPYHQICAVAEQVWCGTIISIAASTGSRLLAGERSGRASAGTSQRLRSKVHAPSGADPMAHDDQPPSGARRRLDKGKPTHGLLLLALSGVEG